MVLKRWDLFNENILRMVAFPGIPKVDPNFFILNRVTIFSTSVLIHGSTVKGTHTKDSTFRDTIFSENFDRRVKYSKN